MTDDPAPTTLDALREGFAHPTPASRPMVRWWWFGPAVERGELLRELDAMAAAGFGGAELSVVYPLSETSDSYLSPTFLADVRFAAEAARERGMRFDLTLGSGWSFGGPHITDRTAARNLHWERLEIGPEATTIPVPAAWPADEFVAAYLGKGSLQEQPDDIRLLDVVDERIVVPAGTGPRVIVTAVSRLTGQNVKRAAHGAEGPVFDHYSLAATRSHIAHVAEPLVAAAGPELLGSVFCDSLEVYGADWTPDAVADFARRRGYDPRPELYLLEFDGADAPRLRRDMYRTLTELYEQNFLVPLQEFAAAKGVPFRIQAYGEPPTAISSYRLVDMIEGEGWGWKEVTQSRWATSAAHLFGKPVVSSETWTWVHSPSFRATPLDLKGEAHEHLLIGINHFIGHGWPYSPPDVPGIGWMFYASGALDDRNPWWAAMPELTTYLHRLAWLMRQGDPAADVAIYAPTDDAYAAMHSGGGGAIDLWRRTRERIGDAIPAAIREHALDFDVVDEVALSVVAPERYPLVVVPPLDRLPDAAARWLDAVTASGGTVLRAEDAEPDLGGTIVAAVAPPLRFTPAAPDLGVVHRQVDGIDVYFVANTIGESQEVEVQLSATRATIERWDAATGQVIERHVDVDRLPLALAGYEATVLIASDESIGLAAVPPLGVRAGREIRLDGPWTVSFGDSVADTPSPVALPHRWEDDPGRISYSGSATYATTVELDEVGPRVLLDFGPALPLADEQAEAAGIRGRSFRAEVATPIGEIAVVTVNGTRAGVVWSTPFRLDIGGHLRAGRNDIRITVANTAANRLAADPTVAEWAAASERRWGRRFRMQELDRAADGVSSGLLTVPVLRMTR